MRKEARERILGRLYEIFAVANGGVELWDDFWNGLDLAIRILEVLLHGDEKGFRRPPCPKVAGATEPYEVFRMVLEAGYLIRDEKDRTSADMWALDELWYAAERLALQFGTDGLDADKENWYERYDKERKKGTA